MNKQFKLDLHGAYHIYLDIPNILKPHHWYTIALNDIITYIYDCLISY